MDLLLAFLALPVATLFVLIAAVALSLELRGSPFFFQQRVGLGGRQFTIAKLRTMRHPGSGEEPRYEVTDWSTFVFSPPGVSDPRLSRLGAFFRKTSIDEIPNLWNVLRGEMSIVGPRPEIPAIVRQYPPEYHRRHMVRPGVTGLAQVRGRSDLAYAEIMKYDLAYVDNHSVVGDLRLLWETAIVVFRGLGAR